VVNGIMKVYDNKLNIITNEPTFPEQVMMLKHYPNFTTNQIKGNSLFGAGFLGLSGDFTSPSRFTRLHTFEKTYVRPEMSLDGINTAFHILNNFDIVKGYVIDDEGKNQNTQYTVVYDLKNFEGYSKTYNDQTIKNIKDQNEFQLINNEEFEGYSKTNNNKRIKEQNEFQLIKNSKEYEEKCGIVPIIILSIIIMIFIVIIIILFIINRGI